MIVKTLIPVFLSCFLLAGESNGALVHTQQRAEEPTKDHLDVHNIDLVSGVCALAPNGSIPSAWRFRVADEDVHAPPNFRCYLDESGQSYLFLEMSPNQLNEESVVFIERNLPTGEMKHSHILSGVTDFDGAALSISGQSLPPNGSFKLEIRDKGSISIRMGCSRSCYGRIHDIDLSAPQP